eukprot:scaffold4425_cov194-Alexandrium_tamarense.AAC.7
MPKPDLVLILEPGWKGLKPSKSSFVVSLALSDSNRGELCRRVVVAVVVVVVVVVVSVVVVSDGECVAELSCFLGRMSGSDDTDVNARDDDILDDKQMAALSAAEHTNGLIFFVGGWCFVLEKSVELSRLLTTTLLTECCRDRRELLQRGGRSFLKEEKRLKRKQAGGEAKAEHAIKE